MTHTRVSPRPPPPRATPRWDHVDVRSMTEDDLPIDPRSWSRSDVSTWSSRQGALAAKFPMNGKALCLMSRDMFQQREPLCGHQMYQDFRRRLSRAISLQELIEKLQKASQR